MSSMLPMQTRRSIATKFIVGVVIVVQSGVQFGVTEEKYSIQLSKDKLQEAFRASHDGWSLDVVRESYESELIRSRKPRLNLSP